MAYKNIVFVEKNNVATTCRENNSAAQRSKQKLFGKNHNPPPPLRLNGYSPIIKTFDIDRQMC